MKPFLLFAGGDEPGGGWKDFRGSYPTLEGALRAARDRRPPWSWGHVVHGERGSVFHFSLVEIAGSTVVIGHIDKPA